MISDYEDISLPGKIFQNLKPFTIHQVIHAGGGVKQGHGIAYSVVKEPRSAGSNNLWKAKSNVKMRNVSSFELKTSNLSFTEYHN